MPSTKRPDQVLAPRATGERGALDCRRRVALLLETAAVLAERARRTQDVAQAQVLLRRSAQRRAQALRLAAAERTPQPRRLMGGAWPGHLAPS
jgi:putative heme degradation protein